MMAITTSSSTSVNARSLDGRAIMGLPGGDSFRVCRAVQRRAAISQTPLTVDFPLRKDAESCTALGTASFEKEWSCNSPR